ncbi:hypothetical protein B566_EDAN017171 [Ephemera danica]|nr:hypothetical protein B566_EDAN017171 [Ephemera danica]
MFKSKSNTSCLKKLEEYAKFSKYLRVTQRKTLCCDLWDKTVDKKSHVTQHIKSSAHEDHVKIQEATNSASSSRQTTLDHYSGRDEFITDVCEMFLAMDIPLYKSKHIAFHKFIEKYIKKTLPSETSLRTTHMPRLHQKCMEFIKEALKSGALYAIVDETTDRDGRYICNVLVGLLLEDGPSPPYLIAVKQLERTNQNTVSRCVDEALTDLFGDSSARNRLLLLLSDAAAYMKAAARLLRAFYPKLTHVTCLVHALHRTCETVRTTFPLVNSWISSIKKVFLKAPSRVRLYKELYPDLALPPEPIEVRFGTWIVATVFQADNFEKIKNVIENIDPEDDAQCVEKARQLVKNEQLPLDLVCVSSCFGFLAGKIKQLEDPKLSLSKSISILDEVITTLANQVGPRATLVNAKLTKVLQNNTGLTFMRQAAKILEGDYTGNTANVMDLLTVKEVTSLKYAQLTSCDVERSFSIYKTVLTDRPEYTEAQINMLKERDMCSPLVLMLICEQLKNSGSDVLVLSIAKAMEHKIKERDRLMGVNMESFRSLIQEAIHIEIRKKIVLLEKRINENRGNSL